MLAFGAALALGCGDDAPTVPPQPVATTATVSPSAVAFDALGDTVHVTATMLDQNGQVMADAPVIWSSSDAAVAAVVETGLVTAVSNGAATVTAASGRAVGSVAVVVEQVVAEVRVSPDSVALRALRAAWRLSAVAVDANGHPVDGATLEWSSGDTAVATVDDTGLVTAVGNGAATVTAASGGAEGHAAVVVEQVVAEVRVSPDSVTLLAVGDTARLTAKAVDANGHPVDGAGFEWSSGDTTVATVDRAGLVTAVGNGAATVSAASGRAVGSVAVVVEQVVAEVRVSPDSVALRAVRAAWRLSAVAVDAHGHPVDGATLAWSSGDTTVATVDDTGLVTAVGNGSATVTAASGGAEGHAAVVVEQVVTEVRVSPDSVALRALRDTVRMTAVAVDANGHPVDESAFEWSSGNTAVATVDDTGLVTAVGHGTTTILGREPRSGGERGHRGGAGRGRGSGLARFATSVHGWRHGAADRRCSGRERPPG